MIGNIRLIIKLIILAIVVGVLIFLFINKDEQISSEENINSFKECADAGNPVMESYPRQCNTVEGKHFIENIGNELEKFDLIRIDSPRPNQKIESPLNISGEAKGTWFFEGDFPVVLTDLDGKIIAEGFVTAQGEWMTEDFVPFQGVLEFEIPDFGDIGTLILRKDNPSGLPEHDDALEVPVDFK